MVSTIPSHFNCTVFSLRSKTFFYRQINGQDLLPTVGVSQALDLLRNVSEPVEISVRLCVYDLPISFVWQVYKNRHTHVAFVIESLECDWFSKGSSPWHLTYVVDVLDMSRSEIRSCGANWSTGSGTVTSRVTVNPRRNSIKTIDISFPLVLLFDANSWLGHICATCVRGNVMCALLRYETTKHSVDGILAYLYLLWRIW